MKGSVKGRRAAILLLICMAFLLSACEQKTINQILAEPDRYANKSVGIVGTVVQSVSVFGAGAYQVDDGTGKIWVVSKTGVPRQGARVGVKGKIRDGYNLSSIVKLPDPISSGLVMLEESHRAR